MEEQITEPNQLGTTSGEVVAGSEDLTTEIFIRLPANTLARCKWVSKQWLSFISNPIFIKKHALAYPLSLSGLFLIPKQPNHGLKVHYTALNHTKTRLPFVDFLNSRGFQIVDSCNGLLICQSEQEHYVCNPTTQQVKILPKCSYMRDDEFTLNLVFDPLKSPRYKVVCLQNLDGQPGIYQIAVYSSETGVWSVSVEPISAPADDIDFKNGVSCNGAIHWLKNTVNGLYLDLNTMSLRDMPELPRRDDHEVSQYKFKHFGASKDNLFYVISRPLLHYYEVYQMKEDYSGWDLKSRLNLNVLVTKYPSMARRFRLLPFSFFSEYECDVLSVNHLGSMEDTEVVLSIPGEVVVLNIQKKTSIRIRDPVFLPFDVTIWYKIHTAYQYFETLSLV